MSDTDDLTTEQESDSALLRRLRGQLKDALRENHSLRSQLDVARDAEESALQQERDEAVQRAEQAELRLACHEAGIAHLPEEKRLAVLGVSEDTDAASLRAVAEKLGFVDEPMDPERLAAVDAAIAAQERFDDAMSNGPPPPAPSLDDSIKQARTPEELQAVLRGAGLMAPGDE